MYFLVVSSLILLKNFLEKVKLSTNEQFQTLITSGHSEFNLSGLDPDQYPLLPEVSRDDAIQLSVKVLKNIIAQTNFAVSTSETRPVLTGVNWLIQDNELICTATDSHRLAVRKLQLEDESENKMSSFLVKLYLN